MDGAEKFGLAITAVGGLIDAFEVFFPGKLAGMNIAKRGVVFAVGTALVLTGLGVVVFSADRGTPAPVVAGPAITAPGNGNCNVSGSGNTVDCAPKAAPVPVTINPPVQPAKKRTARKEPPPDGGRAEFGTRDGTFARQIGDGTMILRDASGCGFKDGLVQSGKGLMDATGTNVSKDCKDGGTELHIGHVEVNPTKPTQPPSAPHDALMAAPPDCHGLVDVSGSENAHVTANFNTIVGPNAQVVCAPESKGAVIGTDHNVVMQTQPVPDAKSP